MNSTKPAIETISRIVSGYFSRKKEIVAVYVFGSYATAKCRSLSDIDIGILLDVNCVNQAVKIRQECLPDLSRLLRKDVHLTVLNSASEALLRQVFEKGRCILINNQKKLSVYTMTTFVRITDFAFYREKMKAGFINKVMGR